MIEMIRGDAAAIPLADKTVDLVVTSPPYNVGKVYPGADDRLLWAVYQSTSLSWAFEIARILKPGGRLFLNIVHNTNTNGPDGRRTGRRRDLATHWHTTLAQVLHYRDVIAWDKPMGNQATAWGSYLSPNALNFRGRWEPILVYFKDHWHRRPMPNSDRGDIDPGEWTTLTRNTWRINQDGQSPWHPATFPIEIPRRAILISTWPGDLVVDPFAGSGTTLKAADQLGRDAIGIEISSDYVRRFAELGVQSSMALSEPRLRHAKGET